MKIKEIRDQIYALRKKQERLYKELDRSLALRDLCGDALYKSGNPTVRITCIGKGKGKLIVEQKDEVELIYTIPNELVPPEPRYRPIAEYYKEAVDWLLDQKAEPFEINCN